MYFEDYLWITSLLNSSIKDLLETKSINTSKMTYFDEKGNKQQAVLLPEKQENYTNFRFNDHR